MSIKWPVRQIVTAIVLLNLIGCTTQVPKEALRLEESSLDIRSMQSRTYEAPSETVILAASIAVLQDMEYNLDKVEKPLGVLTASKLVDADSTGEKIMLGLLDVLCAAGGSGGCNSSSSASDSQKIIVTLVVLPSLASEGEYVTRVTLQRVVYDKQQRVKLMESIDDPETYQDIFTKLSKSLFLQINE
jgi:hypothetical protein